MRRFSRNAPRLALAALLATAALPWVAGAWPGGHGGGKLDARIERLELDAETQGRVEAILEARHERKQALREELHAAREAFHELMAQGDADAASLLAQAELVSNLRFEMQKERIATHLQLREVLSPEQLAELAARPDHEGCDKRHGRRRR